MIMLFAALWCELVFSYEGTTHGKYPVVDPASSVSTAAAAAAVIWQLRPF